MNNEKVHGKVFSSHAFFYISIFENGVSEQEINGILSIDKDVQDELNECDEYNENNHWQTLRQGLAEYLAEKDEDGTRVISWSNSDYQNSAERYIE
jgi:hypothetical protein